jgi:hypothetical protein
MDELDKISQVAIIINNNRQVLVKKENALSLPRADLGLGENPKDSLSNFIEKEFGIRVSDIEVAGVNLDEPGIVTLVYSCKSENFSNTNLTWLPIESPGQSLEPVSAKILEDYKKNHQSI